LALDFNDVASAYATRTNVQLFRAFAVFSSCRPFVVKYADGLLAASRRVIGNYLTDAVLRHTMFAHFCGGEDAESIKPTVAALAAQGVGSILDYAAESDIEIGSKTESRTKDRAKVICRTYTYGGEADCDHNAEIFKQAIRAVQESTDTDNLSFAAVKVTALGVPELLLRVSECITEMRRFFERLDLNGDGVITREEWIAACSEMFSGTADEHGTWFDERRTTSVAAPGGIDYVEWLETATLEELPVLLLQCKAAGPLSASKLDLGELELLAAMRRRGREVVQEAKARGVRVLVDAEHSYFQPAIDLLTNELMREFNVLGEGSTVFNTYQAYLKDSTKRLDADMERAQRRSYGFACKVVRGAYMELERAHAEKQGLPSPIHDSIEDTHANYNRCVRKVMKQVRPSFAFGSAELMVASHNQASTEEAVRQMAELGLQPRDAVYFGQLYGMSDCLTSTLGAAGYRAYKYLPWGPVHEVTPYLLRRAQENSSVCGGAKLELMQISQELRRRVTSAFALPSPA